MSAQAWIVLGCAWLAFLVAFVVFCCAVADPDSDVLRPYDENDQPGPLVDLETGEVIDLEEWAASVVPNQPPAA